MKRFLAIVLAFCLLLTAFPVSAKAAQGGKLVALTFDDGPDSYNTSRLLDGLAQRGVKVTFFVQGSSAQRNLSLLTRMYNEGHELANHSWSHLEMTSEPSDVVHAQFADTNAVLDQVCGAGSEYLVRPPYGSVNDRVIQVIDAPMICWSVDPLDWKYLNAYTVRDNILSGTYDGSIILVHDIHSHTIDGALMAVDQLLAWGYEFVTVSELYRRRGVELKDQTWYYDCRANGTDLGPIATPQISYTTDGASMTVTINSTSGAPVYYTTDGSMPNHSSAVYTGPFTVPYATSVIAVAAYDLNGSRSAPGKLMFGVTPCSTPTISFENGQLVLTSPEGASIYYAFNGQNPVTEGTLYTGPITITQKCMISVVAGGGYYAMSNQTYNFCSPNGNLYTDVPYYAWYFDYVDRVVTAGLMNGVGDKQFAPDSNLTRAMLVTVLYRYCGSPLSGSYSRTNTFADVPEGTWYTEAIEWAYRNNIVSGYSATQFKPDQALTREELCKVIYYFLQYRGKPLAAGGSCQSVFADYSAIQAWALPCVEAMVSAGMISGDGTNMNPRGTATRAQVAKILSAVIDYEYLYG